MCSTILESQILIKARTDLKWNQFWWMTQRWLKVNLNLNGEFYLKEFSSLASTWSEHREQKRSNGHEQANHVEVDGWAVVASVFFVTFITFSQLANVSTEVSTTPTDNCEEEVLMKQTESSAENCFTNLHRSTLAWDNFPVGRSFYMAEVKFRRSACQSRSH